MLRPPAVAGQFYPGTPEKLRNDLENLLVRSDRPDKVLGIMAPMPAICIPGPSPAPCTAGSKFLPRY